MSSNYLLPIIASLLAESAFGQENLGFSNDRFSGISAVIISPTQPFLNPNPWDINLIATDIFVQNDYSYISNQSFLGLRTAKIESVNYTTNITGENTANILDFHNRDFGNFHFSSDILGPSFNLKTRIKDKVLSLGAFTRLRSQSSAVGVDNYLKFSNQNLIEPENYKLESLELNFMNWGEFGINVATEIFPYSEYQWIVGANFKYEMGFDAFHVKSISPIQLNRTSEMTEGVEKKTIYASNFNVEAGYATNYNFELDKYEYKLKGKGLGVDVGITIIDKIEDSEDYNFKVGFHILDIGRVKFRGENHVFMGNSLKLVNNPTFENTKLDSPQEFFGLLSKEVYGEDNASFRGTDFNLSLPTSLHFNMSKNVGAHQYVNADWIQRLPVFENSLRRSNIFNVSYSVQKPVLGYGASMSLYEYKSLQFGGYLRFGPFIIGSENVFPLFFKQKKLHAEDLYIALKIYPFWDNEMKRHHRKDCYCD